MSCTMDQLQRTIKIHGRFVEVPEGYQRIKTGLAQARDLFLNLQTFTFCEMESDDIGQSVDPADSVFDCVIRRTS